MRYFQENLAGDEARFFPGTQWDEIVNIYRLDIELRSLLSAGSKKQSLLPGRPLRSAKVKSILLMRSIFSPLLTGAHQVRPCRPHTI